MTHLASRLTLTGRPWPKEHYLATSRESRRYVVAFRHTAAGGILATSRESKAHFGPPDYAPGTIAVNVTWMKR